MHRVISLELEIYGSHGLAAQDYQGLLQLISAGKLDAHGLVGNTICLDEAPAALAAMGDFSPIGVIVIDRF